jgi:dinuclear metal center YbgI/SA1388 family protein
MSKHKISRSKLIEDLKSIIPLHLAGSWDNVGLIVDSPYQQAKKERVFLTIDLTPDVLDEAIEWQATLIIAYHPPIFSGLKSLQSHQPMHLLLMKAIQQQITIYSPHSALDAVKNGMCDWLALQIGGEIEKLVPIERNQISMEEGAGRIVFLKQALSLNLICQHLSTSLKLPYLRVAAHPDCWQMNIDQIAICPGAGASLFQHLQQPTLYITGEMSHHDLLSRTRNKQAVILTEHSHCERGYLPVLEKQLKNLWGSEVKLKVSERDQDPISLWSNHHD